MQKPVITDFLKTIKYDPDGTFLWSIDENGGLQKVADIRAWGAIQNLFKDGNGYDMKSAAKFQDEMGEFVAAAINDKLEKERGKNKFTVETP